jgi:hypothetical protein
LASIELVSAGHAVRADDLPKQSNIQVIPVPESGDESPDDALCSFTLHSTGRLSLPGAGGSEISDEYLRDFMKGAAKGDPKKVFRFKLLVAKEKEVSVETLGKTLQRFRNCADPNGNYRIYLILHEIKSVEEKKDK